MTQGFTAGPMSNHQEPEPTEIIARYLTARRSLSIGGLQAYLAACGPVPLSIVRALAVAELEYRWETNEPTPVEWVLAQVPELRDDPQAKLELIGVELRWMQSQPDRSAYRERFPELAQELDRLFDLVSLGPWLANDPEASPALNRASQDLSGALCSDAPHALEPTKRTGQPMSLGRYQILRTLGRGGFGEVFAAWDPQLERNVAVKRLLSSGYRSGQAGPDANLLAEARRVALLDHRAIVPVYDIGEQDDSLFVVSRLIDGESLDQHLLKPWPWRRVARAMVRIADALAYAHARGIIHRDIKPANILVDSAGFVFLNDFGLAMLSDSLQDRPTQIVGTLPYLAPELLSGHATASETTDIFSVGVVFYQLLTGRLPWNAREIGALKRLHMQGEASFPDAAESVCPPAVQAVCERAVRREPTQRYSSAAQFARELRRAVRFGTDSHEEIDCELFAAKLPANLTRIVGREIELDWLRENILQRQRRLITITGMGGVGKSRLALELGWEIADELGNRVYFVELAVLHQASLVLPRILELLEVPEPGRESPLAALANYFGQQRSLLLLDNFEQVLSAGPQLTLLLERCPGLQIVVTSRIPLGIRGEQILPLAPLAQPDSTTAKWLTTPGQIIDQNDPTACASIELFTERARETLPDFRVDASNYQSVCNLCRRLDGLPLAIELAAGRLASLSLEELETRLTRRRLLTQPGPNDLPTRQRTLWNTIQWSVDLLSPVAREIFCTLSLFGAGATREAVEAIFQEPSDLALSPDWEAACDEVIASSLVRIDRTASPARWNMLETVREFARIEFEKHPHRERRLEAFGQFYLRLAETAARRRKTAEQMHWLQTIDHEYGNFRSMLQESVSGQLSAETGLRVAAALWWFWETRGMFEEGLFWLRSLITSDPEVSPATLGAACNASGNLARNRGRVDEAEKQYQRALTLRRSAGDECGVSDTLLNLGNIVLGRSDWLKADQLYRQSLEIRRSIGDNYGVALALSNLALTAINLAEFIEAESRIVESLSLFEQCGDARQLARVTDIHGELAQSRGNYQDAIAHHEKAWTLREKLGDRMGVGLSRKNLAWSCFKAGMIDLVPSHLLASLAIWQQIGADGEVPSTLELVAELALIQHQLAAAAQLFAAAIKLSGDAAQNASRARLEEIRQQILAEIYDQAVDAGRSMSLSAACEYARALLTHSAEKSS